MREGKVLATKTCVLHLVFIEVVQSSDIRVKVAFDSVNRRLVALNAQNPVDGCHWLDVRSGDLDVVGVADVTEEAKSRQHLTSGTRCRA